MIVDHLLNSLGLSGDFIQNTQGKLAAEKLASTLSLLIEF
jgi:hypothetical protein